MGMRDVKQALIGDTFHHVNKPVLSAPGCKQPTPMVNFNLKFWLLVRFVDI